MAYKAGNDNDRKLCFGLDDLRIGTFIHVYSRSFFIHDCDDFTRQWYKVSLNSALNATMISGSAYCRATVLRMQKMRVFRVHAYGWPEISPLLNFLIPRSKAFLYWVDMDARQNYMSLSYIDSFSGIKSQISTCAEIWRAGKCHSHFNLKRATSWRFAFFKLSLSPPLFHVALTHALCIYIIFFVLQWADVAVIIESQILKTSLSQLRHVNLNAGEGEESSSLEGDNVAEA